MSYTPPTPYSVVPDGSLTEDYIFTQDIIVSQSSSSPMGVFQDSDGNTAALVITADDGTLVHVYADTLSPSGWNVTPVSPQGTTVAEVVAGLHSDNTIYGFYTDSSNNLYYTSLGANGWSTPTALNVAITCLRATYNGSSLVAYGSDSSGNLQIVSDSGSGFQVIQIQNIVVKNDSGTYGTCWNSPGAGITPSCLFYIPSTASFGIGIFPTRKVDPTDVKSLETIIVAQGGPFYSSGYLSGPITFPADASTQLLVYIEPSQNYLSSIGDSIASFTNNRDFLWPRFCEGLNSPAVWATVLMPNLTVNSDYYTGDVTMTIVLCLDSNQNFSYYALASSASDVPWYSPFDNNSGTLANGPFQQAVALLDTDSVAHIYLLDNTGVVSVVHQVTAVDGQTNISTIPDAFITPIPILTGVASMAVAPNVQDVKALFTVGTDGFLYFHQQTPTTDDSTDPNSGAWTSVRVQQPGQAEGYYVTQYLTELLVLDANGVPVPGAEVSITTETPSTITVAGTSSFVSSTQPLSCTADITGSIRLATIASAIGTTSLTVSGPQFTTPQTVWPDAAVQSYLRGNSGLNGMPVLTASTLMSATKANGDPLFPVLQSSDQATNQTFASQAVTAIQQVYQAGQAYAAQTPSDSSATDDIASKIVGFHMDWSDLSNPKLTLLHTEEEFQAYHAGLSMSIFSDVTHDLSHLVGDIYHGLKTAAITVTQWTVSIAESTVTLVTNELGALSAIPIRCLDDVVSVVHSIFNAIGAAISDVIDYLKALFNWGDIWNTKLVIEHWIQQGGLFLQDLITQYAETAVSDFFTKLEKEVTHTFGKLEAKLGNSAISGNASNSPMPAASSSSSSPAPSARGNWMMDKIRGDASSSGLPSLNLKSGSPLETALTNLKTTFLNPPNDADWYGSLKDTCTAAWTALQKLAADPSKISTVGVSDLIQILEHLIKTALKATDWLISLMLDLVNAVIALADDILDSPLNLPLVSWVYKNFICPSDQQEPLTLRHAIALLAALPTTLLYKLTHSGNAPFTSDQVTQILAQTFSASSGTQTVMASVRDDSSPPLVGDFLTIVLAVETLSNSLADLAAQAEEDVAARLATLFNALLSWTAQVLCWPGGTPFTQIQFSSMTGAEKVLSALWVANWIPPVVSLAWTGVTWANTALEEDFGSTERVEDIGIAIVSVIGAIREYLAMVGSIWTIVDDDLSKASIESGIENVLGQLPDTLELLRLSAIVDATDGITVPIKIALNAVCNMSVAGLQAAQTGSN